MTVDFKFEDCFAEDVDNWLQFALTNKVKELRWNMGYNKDCYILREIIYSNSSLTSLCLHHCILVPERTIQWSSLTKLGISRVNLPQPIVENILSGCPVLTSLDLSECWGFTCLEINSQNLCKLLVTDPLIEINGSSLHISAPYIKYLNLCLDPIGRKIKIRDISSLVTAHFDFIDNSWDFILHEDMLRSTKEFFEQIYNVKELGLGPEPLKALAALVLNGWQLPKYKLRCLKIDMLCDAGQIIPGILNVLESSPDIETLVIDSYEPEDLDSNWAPPAKDDLYCDLLHLKTIKMIKLVDPELDGEPMLTLARILLKRTPVLEEMDVYVNIEDADVFIKIGQTLLSYPRSSPKAVIDLY